jgi:DNA modification methylase
MGGSGTSFLAYRERQLNVGYLPIGDLKQPDRRARRHSKKKIRKLSRSLERFGFACPIVIDEDNFILSGNALYEAAKMLGREQVPTIRISDLSDADKRALVLAINRLAEDADWDKAVLLEEFTFLLEEDFDLDDLGFDTAFVDDVFSLDGDEERPVELPDDTAPAVSRLGDCWVLGDHRLVCGDARDPRAYVTLLEGEQAEMAITDPPFNLIIEGNVSGLGRKVHGEFAMASGEMTPAEFTAFLRDAFARMVAASMDGAIHFVFMDWRHLEEMLAASKGIYPEFKNLIVWAKTNAGMGTFYRSQHELIFAFKVGTGPHINNFGLGRSGRHRSNVWTYPGANVFRAGRNQDLEDHPTVKPIQLFVDAIADCSKRGDIILDPFAGSGTILLAAQRAGRRARAIELDPRYVDLCIRRFRDETGIEAVHEGGGTFDQIAAARIQPDTEAA